MNNVTNLRKIRKARARDEHRARGDANAAKYGEAKSTRDARAAEQARTDRTHDGHKRDD